MSPCKGPPPAKLLQGPRPLSDCSGTSHYSTYEGVRTSLVAPSIGTCPSGYIPGDTRDAMYHPEDKRSSVTTNPRLLGAVRGYRREVGTPAIAIPGSIAKAPPQRQGCGNQGCCANPNFTVVPTRGVRDRASQFIVSQQEKVGRPEKTTQEEASSPHPGFRRISLDEPCHQNTLAQFSVEGIGAQGGTAKMPPPQFGQLRAGYR